MSNEVIAKYGRMYVQVNPNPSVGPDTYRLAVTDATGGGGGSNAYSFNGVSPIDVDTFPGAVEGVQTSMDFKQLDSRSD